MSIQDDHIARAIHAFENAAGEYYGSRHKKDISKPLLQAKDEACTMARIQLTTEINDLIRQAVDKAVEEINDDDKDAFEAQLKHAVDEVKALYEAKPSKISVFEENKEGFRRDLQAIADNLVYIEECLDRGAEHEVWQRLFNWCKFRARDLQHKIGSM